MLFSILCFEGKKGQKAKKKGLKLEPEQEAALVNITGCLKFLSTSNMDRYRIAKLGAVPGLICLHENAERLILRRNAQVTLNNLAMLADISSILNGAGMSDEFSVTVPMKLEEDEIEQLKKEFESDS